MNLQIKTILVGILAGIIGGFFGIIGSSVLLPMLLLFSLVPNFNTANGTILFTLLLPTTLLGVVEYNKRHQIDYKLGVILAITTFFSSYIGAYFNSYFSEKILMYGCAIIYLFTAIYFCHYAHGLK